MSSRVWKVSIFTYVEQLWTEEHKRLPDTGVSDSEPFTYDNLEYKLRQCIYPAKPTQIDKVWGLLSDDQESMRNQGIQLFLTLSLKNSE